MKIDKKIVSHMQFPYAISLYGPENDKKVICATQDKGGAICFDAKDGTVIENAWTEPGGTMTIWPVPGRDEFLATHRFHRAFEAKKSHIVHVKRDGNGNYTCTTCLNLAYLHRFTVVDVEDEQWLVAAVLCRNKEYKDDWSTPGSIYFGKLPEDLDEEIEVRHLTDGITKNHGMYTGRHNGQKQVVIVTGMEGAFEIIPPEKKSGEWKIRRLLETEISDIRVYDIDGDGVDELITIESFHGDRLNIYHKTEEGYELVYSYPVAFGHSFWCGEVFGKRTIIIGYQQANGALLFLQPKENSKNLSMNQIVIDELEGPSNIDVWDDGSAFRIYASCATGKVIMYTLTS